MPNWTTWNFGHLTLFDCDMAVSYSSTYLKTWSLDVYPFQHQKCSQKQEADGCGVWSEPTFWLAEGCLLLESSHSRKQRVGNSSTSLLMKTLVRRAPPSWPNHFPKNKPPNTITLKVMMGVWGATNIQWIPLLNLFFNNSMQKSPLASIFYF